MKLWRWLLVVPLVLALVGPSLAQQPFLSRGGGFSPGFHPGGVYRPGGRFHPVYPGRGARRPGPRYGDGAPPRYWPLRPWPPRIYDAPPPRYVPPPPPAMVESDVPLPPRQVRRPVAVREAPPPRVRVKKPVTAAPLVSRALLPAVTEKRLAPDEILVAFQKEAPGQAENFARAEKLDLVETRSLKLIGVSVHRLKLPRGADLRKTLRRAGRDARVAWAQPNFLYQLQEGAQGSVQSQGSIQEQAPEGYAGAALNLADAHKLALGKGVAVAVIDSQVDAAHPEFWGVAAEAFDAVGGAGAPHAHGTAMAGAISGHVKLVGAAPAARLLAVRAFDPAGGAARGATLPIVAGLDWAADKGARVVSMSFAGPADPLMERMVVAAASKNMALIAAAGNEGPGAPPQYPAAYPPVIAVAAVDETGKIYRQGNRGAYIKLAAPGVDVIAAAPNGGYDLSTGTSIACAEVSGVAALLLEKTPGLDLKGLRRILAESARKIAGENFGAADAAAALAAK
ncbi:subtilisin family serine protease [Rhodoblastus acidophilus]|uniref:S8 family peptidase n=1 Tax=Rhodoblastus acidophilus TaxID=1074 RepID=UPI0022255E46|nr:S8 family serine peptidase [Rhodoblastus acidophilus]MCW2283309.1 subtilisin family serine protease [Rhodoblastus acidophilus]MCW2332169.1 subtilisin family serine protease [Rhodoblastus acidophilus]